MESSCPSVHVNVSSVNAVSPASYSHFAIFFIQHSYFCTLVIKLLACLLSVLSYREYSANSGAGSSVVWKVLNFALSTCPLLCKPNEHSLRSAPGASNSTQCIASPQTVETHC